MNIHVHISECVRAFRLSGAYLVEWVLLRLWVCAGAAVPSADSRDAGHLHVCVSSWEKVLLGFSYHWLVRVTLICEL